jgi:hypothetical protein
MMKYLSFYHNGKYLLGKVTNYAAREDTYTVYVADETGGFHLNVFGTEVVGEEVRSEDLSKPARYNKTGTLECWDVILDQKMDFLEGNVLKYLWRHKEKKGAEDLKKAVEYLNKMIKDYDKLYK